MNKLIVRIAPIVAALAVAGASQAFVYVQNWDGTSNMTASQNDTNGFGNFASVYDNFTIGSNMTLTEVLWVGGYFNPASQGPITAWTVNIYGDSSGTPGGLLASFNQGGTANETSLGFVNDFPMFVYDMGISFNATAGTQYWLSVVPDLGFPPQWGWAAGTGGDGTSVQDFFGTRSTIGNDMAFALEGRERVLTPEPFTTSLGIAGIGLFVRRRRARNS